MQIVFQDPYSSLNPRQRVADIIRAPLDIHGVGTTARRAARASRISWARWSAHRPGRTISRTSSPAGSGSASASRGRSRFSPDLIICDEPVSALDVSVQAQILNLLVGLQRDLGLSYLFISHDLGVVKHISDRVAVMYLGRIVEIASRDLLFESPGHPYTELLLAIRSESKQRTKPTYRWTRSGPQETHGTPPRYGEPTPSDAAAARVRQGRTSEPSRVARGSGPRRPTPIGHICSAPPGLLRASAVATALAGLIALAAPVTSGFAAA